MQMGANEEGHLHRKLSRVFSIESKHSSIKNNKGTTEVAVETKSFSSDDHRSALLKGLNHLRSDETLCDVTLIPGDGLETFPVHRVVMASSSDYFKAMFTGGMKEQDLRTIKLHGLSCVGLKNIIDFIYTAKVSLNIDNLQDTLEAASFLQIMPVLNFCKELLISEVTTDNCVEVERIANNFHLTEVNNFINDFVLENFSRLLKDSQYIMLSEASLEHALASDSLKGCTEMELFRAACDWIHHDKSRKVHMFRLMKHIRFPLMSPSELYDISQEAAFLRSDTDCVNLLLEASNYQMMPYMQPNMQTERTQIRSDATHLVTVGGVLRQHLVVSKELRLYDEASENWKVLRPMDVPRYQHGLAVIGNFLYIVGGQSNYDTKGKTAVDTVYRYDAHFNKWLQVASLNEKRTFFHLSALKGKLYAAGGRNSTGEIASVECYNLQKNEWTFVCPMSEPHYGHAGTVHGDLMYISGGITHDTFQKELTSYDPETNTWSRKADMSTVRGLHCMCTFNDHLYVIGGNHFRGTSDYDDVLSCEYYSPEIDQWTDIAPMLRGQSDVGVAVFKNKIFVIGGYSWNSRCMVDIVQCYDTKTDEWQEVFDVPEPIGGVRACSMTVHPPEDTVESQTNECPLSTKS
ncbi:KLH13 protein, partial [Polypterus senegalus]|nr:kelch-like protein 9 [Polypterus senegalus]MBN3290913.1 KLH13 protein [Polypterus senegalus]